MRQLVASRMEREDEKLRWLGEMYAAAKTVASQHADLEERPRLKSLNKFKEEMEEMGDQLFLNDDIRLRGSFYLPHLRVRMGDRRTTCAAIIFLACYKARAPRSLQEVASVAEMPVKQLRLRVDLIQKHMGERKWWIQPELLLNRFCAKLDLPFSKAEEARKLLRRRPFSNCDPSVLAGSALLIVCPTLSVSAVQRATGVSHTSLIKRARLLH